MTNFKLLREKVEECGISYTFLAKKVGITREALYKKMQNQTEFKASEISKVSEILRLNQKEINSIFFAVGVELNSTNNLLED